MSTIVAQTPPERRFLGGRMTFLAFCSQNFATGLTFGSFGTSVLAIEAQFATSRTLASLGLALVILGISCTAPLVGARLQRWSIRSTMIAGVLLGLVGYLLLAVVPNIYALLAVYLLLIGPSLALFGPLVSNTLAANWYVEGRGRALGIVNMPVLVMVVPLVSVAILKRYGLDAVFVAVALAHLPMLFLAMLVIDRPDRVGQLPAGVEMAAPGARTGSESLPPMLSGRAILQSPEFWLLTAAIGVVVGAGAMKVAHMVPLMIDRHRSLDDATLLLAISGGTGVFGSIVFGWLADRYGAARTLMMNAFLQAVVWVILLLPVGMALLIVDAAIIGLCGGGMSSAQGVLLGRLYGTENYPKVLGLLSFATVPFLFGMTPLAGLLYDSTGSYLIPVGTIIAGLALAGLAFASMRRIEMGRSPLAAIRSQLE